ncbi:geraniol 8-hydroxylase [Populus alba]|uniref:geraniol 8-hydroxylase n=1 Tax=Populus alba TaxID=43335 RepID=UPI0015898B11|nr:geraniol 8-hydroxylase-like [Populus alba]XP_034897620.1 geraniol 8-hydroxylase-like [Populus alba]
MESLINLVLCVLFTSLLVKILHFIARGSKTESSGKLPPGPAALPIIGSLLDLGDKPHKSLARLAKIHGPLMSLKLGQITTVVVSSSTLAKEVLQKHDVSFSNRTIPDAIRAHKHHEVGLPWVPIAMRWRNLRKVCNSYIFTNQKLDANQDLRRKKIQELVALVQEHCLAGEAMDIGQAAFTTAVNALSNSIFSLNLSDSNSDTASQLKEVVGCIMEEAGKPNLADYFPVLRGVDLQGIKRRMAIHFGKILNIFDGIVNERLQLRKMQGYVPVNDMLDTLLTISEDNNEGIMETSQIKHLFLDLFAAGTDTTSSTLEWAMAELLHNPRTLSKARTELEQTIGKGSLIEESDIVRLPYLQAVIKETFRLHPAVPLLLPRKAGENVEISGYTIPKGAQLFVNAWAIGRDPSLWEDPESFVPERFLGSDIDARGRNFELIPFGAGRRICPGLPLAMRMLHMMLGSLIHSFDWKLENGVTPESMDMEDKCSLTLEKAQSLRAVPIQL